MPHDSPRPLLDVAGIAAGYRRLQVLWGVDLVVHEHESVVLLGANGAGKTTLLKAIMSLVEVWAGRIDFADENITRLRTDQRVQRGTWSRTSLRRPIVYRASGRTLTLKPGQTWVELLDVSEGVSITPVS